MPYADLLPATLRNRRLAQPGARRIFGPGDLAQQVRLRALQHSVEYLPLDQGQQYRNVGRAIEKAEHPCPCLGQGSTAMIAVDPADDNDTAALAHPARGLDRGMIGRFDVDAAQTIDRVGIEFKRITASINPRVVDQDIERDALLDDADHRIAISTVRLYGGAAGLRGQRIAIACQPA